MTAPRHDAPYGLLAEFETAAALRTAASAVRRAGYRAVETYTPFPVREIEHELGRGGWSVPAYVLVGVLAGFGGALLVQWYSLAVDYPINVGGRPLEPWPAFLLPAIQAGTAAGAVFGLVGMLRSIRLPRLHHPLWSVDGFAGASTDRLFLCIAASDPRFHAEETRALLRRLGARSVVEVPPR